jgi:hypothetical protein
MAMYYAEGVSSYSYSYKGQRRVAWLLRTVIRTRGLRVKPDVAKLTRISFATL